MFNVLSNLQNSIRSFNFFYTMKFKLIAINGVTTTTANVTNILETALLSSVEKRRTTMIFNSNQFL